MNIFVQRDQFSEMVNYAHGVSTNLTTIKSFSYILLEAYEDQLVIMATSSDQTFRGSMKAKIIDGQIGRVALPATLLKDIISVFRGKELNISSDLQSRAAIRDPQRANVKLNLYGTSSENFPDLTTFPETATTIVMPQKDLKQAISQTLFCCSDDPLRSYLRGVLFHSVEESRNSDSEEKTQLYTVATDSRRMSLYADFSSNLEIPKKLKTIIPERALGKIGKILKNEGDLTIAFTAGQVYFRLPGIDFSTTIIEGAFPDYGRALSKETQTTLMLPKDALTEALYAIQPILDRNSPQIRIKVEPEEIELSSHNSPRGTGKFGIELEQFEGESLSIGVNHRYLKEAVEKAPHTMLQIKFSGANDAIRIEGIPANDTPSEIEEASKSFFLVMPMRLEEAKDHASSANNDSSKKSA